ncbi:hypothetical protein D9611_012720 [Ephemerocybe angulata]|uniref:Cation efflux protein cytoplasmic domain-containing protein n=1 Tax=Ephemerocybe angulata TaxID=980116 RepID=A0A8H5BAT2_9AGAR|nr:hypothetical protein D9611_012720 [Tulosesus angulatus]
MAKPDDKLHEASSSTTTTIEASTSGDGANAVPQLGYNDPEVPSSSSSAVFKDPFQFQNGLVPDEDLAGLRNRKKGKHVEQYQRNQNDLIKSLLKPMEEHTEDAKAEEETARLPVKIAIYASLYCNFVLCGLQLYAAISSGSLSLLATGIDSVFDIGSNVLLWWLHRKAVALDTSKWPVGGARLETIGNIIYGFLPRMGTVNLIVVVQSIQALLKKEGDELQKFHLPSIIVVAISLAVKFVLFLYSFSIRKQSSQVQVLWEDHRNDLFINGFGILMSAGGSKLRWWLDPMGAIMIGAGIIILWTHTVYEQFGLLAGRSAPHEFLQLLIYKAATFSEDISKLDTVRAYHSGPNYFVEIDIVMDADTPLWKAHDVSQQLQDKIEVLPNVERAFVHVDYETTHYPSLSPQQYIASTSEEVNSGSTISSQRLHLSVWSPPFDGRVSELTTDAPYAFLALSTGVARYYLMITAFYIIVWTSRFSILFSVIRIDPSKFRKRALLSGAFMFFVVCAFLIAQLYWTCEPQHAWKKWRVPQCTLSKQVAITQLVFDTVADLVVLIVPLQLLVVLQDKWLRSRLMMIFSTCMITTVVSLVHAIAILTLKGPAIVIVALVESSISLIVCNLPVIATALLNLGDHSPPRLQPNVRLRAADRTTPGIAPRAILGILHAAEQRNAQT